MKGEAAMVQAIVQVLIVGLLTGLVGIIWIIVRDVLQEDHYPGDIRLAKTPSPEPRNGEEPHDPSSRPSKIAA